MQCPDHALAAAHNFAHSIERNHALVDPVEVDDVCLLEGCGAGYVDACIGDVHLPEPRAPEAATGQDCEAFHEFRQLVAYLDDGGVVALLVAHYHPCLNAVLVEGIHEAVRSNGAAAASFAGTN